ncbi:MAG: hypothetical protein AAFY38_01155 [Pseudomonadota bacterium]
MTSFLKAIAFALCLIAGSAAAEGRWHASGAAGVLTNGSWHEALWPPEVDFADSYMLAAAIGWDRQLGNGPFRLGVEAQLTAHAGTQDHFELSVPVTLRYMLPESRFFHSIGGGIGLSYATDVPEVEIARSGASQQFLLHWMAEIEFARPDPDSTLFLRLHHRSDAYGLFSVDAGSNAYLFGFRRRY